MPHPLCDDLLTAKEAAKLMAPVRPTETGYRTTSSLYRMRKDGRLSDYGENPILFSRTEILTKYGPRRQS